MAHENTTRRAFIRVQRQMIIRYRALAPAEATSHPLRGAIRNMSATGICLHTSQRLPEEERLVVEIQLPNDPTPITPVARVAWCRPRSEGYDIGLELMWLDWQDDERLRFTAFIHENLGEETAHESRR